MCLFVCNYGCMRVRVIVCVCARVNRNPKRIGNLHPPFLSVLKHTYACSLKILIIRTHKRHAHPSLCPPHPPPRSRLHPISRRRVVHWCIAPLRACAHLGTIVQGARHVIQITRCARHEVWERGSLNTTREQGGPASGPCFYGEVWGPAGERRILRAFQRPPQTACHPWSSATTTFLNPLPTSQRARAVAAQTFVLPSVKTNSQHLKVSRCTDNHWVHTTH